MMASNSLTECLVCNEEFDESARCPRTLPCSHYLCSECVENLIQNSKTHCPLCRQGFEASSASDVMINRAILEFLKCHIPKDAENKSESDTLNYLRKETEDAINSILKRSEVEKTNSDCLLQKIESMFSDLDSEELLVKQIFSKLSEFEEGKKSKKKDLVKENYKVTVSTKEMEKKVAELRFLKAELNGAKTFEETGSIMDKVKHLDVSCEECKVTSRTTIPFIEKDIQDTKEKLQIILEVISSLKMRRNTTEAKDEKIPKTHPTVSIKDLQDMPKRVKELATEGKLFAVQHCENAITKFGNISQNNNKLHLHHLEDIIPPPGTVTIKYDEVLTMVDPSARLSFLELRANGITYGTLYIHLLGDTQGARHFALLCTGEMGPSYANSPLVLVKDKGKVSERVILGDYEKRNGTGGKAMLPDLSSGLEYTRQVQEGLVIGVGWATQNVSLSAQFMICMANNIEATSKSAFGRVVEGLDLLKAAIINFSNIKSVGIGDCGLVLNSVSLQTVLPEGGTFL